MDLVARAEKRNEASGGAALRARRAAASPCARLSGEQGWTLMEMMVVTSLIAILAAIAIPQFSAVALQMRTNAAANELLDDIQYARVMSQRTGVPHYINANYGGGSGVNYKVQREAAPPALAPGSDPALRTVNLGPKMAGVVFAQNGTTTDCFGGTATTATPASQLVFSSRGLPVTSSSYFVGSNDGQNVYVISVTGAGRARLCHRVGGAWK